MCGVQMSYYQLTDCHTATVKLGKKKPYMTRNRMRVAIQSVCVTKILALQRWSKIDFPPEFQTRQMHSFPIMYNTMGSKVDGLAVRDHFLPKNGLKTAIWAATVLDRLTSEGAGTQIFKGIANFSMCFKKIGTLPSKAPDVPL